MPRANAFRYKFVCVGCDYHTYNCSHMKRHMKIHVPKISRVSIQNPTPSNGLSEEVLSVLDFEKEERMNDVYNRNMKKNFNDTGVFQCPVPNCNRVYSRRRSLSRHRQECGQLPRFHCSLCPYKSKRRDLLKSHMKHGHKLEHITEDQIIVRKDSPVLVAE
ncbi:hypothetical protein M8J75_012323 [Diaphorina citri]|nr:hypothetical protein M8J75_012323 [Diaphorina citri]